MYTTATPWEVRSRITRKRVLTSCWSSAADGSSITISRVSWESARAMLTICWPEAGRVPTSRSARISCVTQPGQQGAGRLAGLGAADEPAARLLVSQEDVLGHGQPGDEVELLVDRGDARG